MDECKSCWACCNDSDKDGVADVDDWEDDVVAYVTIKLESELVSEKANDINVAKTVSKQSSILIVLFFIMVFFSAYLITIA